MARYVVCLTPTTLWPRGESPMEPPRKDVKIIKNKQERTHIISFRLSEAEYESLLKNTEKAELTTSSYLRKCLEHQPIVKIYQCRELLEQISRIGNNINQIARVANRCGSVDSFTLNKILSEMDEVYGLTFQFFSQEAVSCPL